MRRLIGSGIDFLVDSGFLYLPLLYDPDIERETRAILDTTESQEATGSVIINEGKSLRNLCESTLKKKDLTIEEQLILEDINRQLDGGKFLSRGQEIDSRALEYAVIEKTEAGEKYLYVPIRAIKPQEGGCSISL